ncbi:MAG: galactokinase [Kiritimatiellae bacterium]|nr:galactokinase [Kiritimatiellia bacterium]
MQNESVYRELLEKFVKQFGREPSAVAYAPGRIEVLGNHTDYNEGFVFSAAIDCGTFFAAAPSGSSECRLVAADLMHEVVFDLHDIRPDKENDTWQNYVKGTFAGLIEGHDVKEGFLGMFLGNIPLGSGLSSSAALEMCTGLCLAKLYGIAVEPVPLAKIGQKAEHEYAGCKCGLLDQISSLAGKAGMLVKTDFRSLVYETVNMGNDVCFLMCNTVKHELVSGEYDQRRAACEAAAAHFAKELRHPVTHLRDVSMAEWAIYKRGLDETVANRAAHPIGEDERVLLGAERLKRGDLAGFGQLMFDSHYSSRYLFENSCEELDFVVDEARKIPGVYGARLSGGGFGGSVVVLVNPRDAETASVALANAYKAKYGTPCNVSVIHPSDGAHTL